MKFVCLFLAIVTISVVICLDPEPDSILKNAQPHVLAAHLEKCKNLHDIDDVDIRNEFEKKGRKCRQKHETVPCMRGKSYGLGKTRILKFAGKSRKINFSA